MSGIAVPTEKEAACYYCGRMVRFVPHYTHHICEPCFLSIKLVNHMKNAQAKNDCATGS